MHNEFDWENLFLLITNSPQFSSRESGQVAEKFCIRLSFLSTKCFFIINNLFAIKIHEI